MSTRILPIIGLTAVLAAATVPAGARAAAARPVHYAGKTKEGTKISLRLVMGHVENVAALLPTSCVSAQGGTPRATLTLWSGNRAFRFGLHYRWTDRGGPTTTYRATLHRHGRRITGRLAMNYSVVEGGTFGDYRLLSCLGTGSFDLLPPAARS